MSDELHLLQMKAMNVLALKDGLIIYNLYSVVCCITLSTHEDYYVVKIDALPDLF